MQPDTTGELLRRGEPLPTENRPTKATTADQEKLVQRYGLTCVVIGLILAIGAVTIVAVVASNDPELQTWPGGRLILCGTFVLAAMITGGVFLAAGLIEKLDRYSRTQGRRAIAEQVRAGKERDADRRELVEALQSVVRAVEKIAVAVPVELDQRWFAGYSRGAEDDLTGTGTDGQTYTPKAIPIGRRRPPAH